MNAPANISHQIASETRTQAERAHRSAISIHCPNEGEWEMNCRVGIAIMRDQAAAGMRHCSSASYGILAEVAKLATAAVYAPADAKKLTMMRAALTLAMDAARAIERVSRDG